MENNNNYKKEWAESLCHDSWKEIYRFIYYKVQNREEAEDITQETYARALSYFEKEHNQITDHVNYLKTIAINIIRDQWRLKKRKGSGISLEVVDPGVLAQEDFTDDLDDRELLEGAMAKLTKEQHAVITLRIIEGYSVRDTAKLMGIKEGNVRVIQYRAVKALSELLGKQQGRI